MWFSREVDGGKMPELTCPTESIYPIILLYGNGTPLEGGSGRRKCRIMIGLRLGPRNRVMHKTVHTLTMLLMLYHVLVGCCWHHAHAESPTSRADGSLNTACCGHDHGEHHDGQEPADRPHQQDGDCDDGMCFFVVPQADGGAELVDKPAPATGLCLDLHRQSRSSRGWPPNEAPPPSGIPPLRLHLVNQILLI